MMRCGGTTEEKEMTPEVIEICNEVKAALEEKLGSACDVFEPKSFKSQVRIMYRVYSFLRIFQITISWISYI